MGKKLALSLCFIFVLNSVAFSAWINPAEGWDFNYQASSGLLPNQVDSNFTSNYPTSGSPSATIGTDALTGETVLVVDSVKAGYYNLFQYKTGVGSGNGTEENFELSSRYRLMNESVPGQQQWMLKVDRPGAGGTGSKTVFLAFQDNCIQALSAGNVWVKKFGSYLYTWHDLKVTVNFVTGQTDVYVDNSETPILSYTTYSGTAAPANAVVFGDGSGNIGGKVAISNFSWTNNAVPEPASLVLLVLGGLAGLLGRKSK